MIEKHYKKMKGKIYKLKKSQRSNPYILSILLTESFFRKQIRRHFEIIYWIFCFVFNSNRIENISIGIAQMQIKHWISLGYFENKRPTINKIKMAYNSYINYDICEDYLRSYNILKEKSLFKIAKFYRGRVGKYYFEVASYFFQKLTVE